MVVRFHLWAALRLLLWGTTQQGLEVCGLNPKGFGLLDGRRRSLSNCELLRLPLLSKKGTYGGTLGKKGKIESSRSISQQKMSLESCRRCQTDNSFLAVPALGGRALYAASHESS